MPIRITRSDGVSPSAACSSLLAIADTGHAAGERLVAAARTDNEKSIAVLKQHGLQFLMQEKDVDPAELLKIRDQAAQVLAKSGYIPQPVFDRVRVLLDEYRRKKPGA